MAASATGVVRLPLSFRACSWSFFAAVVIAGRSKFFIVFHVFAVRL
jgi:hypothetical protein